jgi:hypothetical protein
MSKVQDAIERLRKEKTESEARATQLKAARETEAARKAEEAKDAGRAWAMGAPYDLLVSTVDLAQRTKTPMASGLAHVELSESVEALTAKRRDKAYIIAWADGVLEFWQEVEPQL